MVININHSCGVTPLMSYPALCFVILLLVIALLLLLLLLLLKHISLYKSSDAETSGTPQYGVVTVL